MKKYILPGVLVFIFFLSAQVTFAQEFPPSEYQSASNKLYWKNRVPVAGYWQQDVHYFIKASIDEKTDIVTGSLKLKYINNSPDDLSFVYLSLIHI